MSKKAQASFRYPTNLQVLDLATLINLYRNRGNPVKAPAGEYFCCVQRMELIRVAKDWFGIHYSQEAWDDMLSAHADGYPLTEVEFNVLGLAREGQHNRSYLENHCGTIQQLAFMIVNDLKAFGFIEEKEDHLFHLTSAGGLALEGLALHLFEKRYHPSMLSINAGMKKEDAKPDGKSGQSSLF